MRWKKGTSRTQTREGLSVLSEKVSQVGMANPSHECFFESLPHDFERPEVGYPAARSGPVVQSHKVSSAGDLHR